MLNVDNLTVRRGNKDVLRQLSLHVPTASITAVLGPSGSGKTTLLRAIAGIIRVDSGSITIDGNDVSHLPPHKRNVGLMFQDGQLFPTMDVMANVSFGLRMQKMSTSDRHKRATELLELVELRGYDNRDVTTLSGGEARRVALARSLAPTPRVLLLDEPLTGLDENLKYQLAHDLADILRDTQLSVVLVTHDQKEADILATSVVELAEINHV